MEFDHNVAILIWMAILCVWVCNRLIVNFPKRTSRSFLLGGMVGLIYATCPLWWKWIPGAFDLSTLKNRGHNLLDPTERESEDFTLGQPEGIGHRSGLNTGVYPLEPAKRSVAFSEPQEESIFLRTLGLRGHSFAPSMPSVCTKICVQGWEIAFLSD